MLVENLELAGLILCQLLFVGVFIWTLVDGGFFEPKPKVVDLGRVENGNREIKRVYPVAGAGSFSSLVQGQGNEPVTGSDWDSSHLQRETAEDGGQGVGSIHGQFGPGISRQGRGGEGEGPRDGELSQEESELDDGGFREYLKRRAEQCGLFGPRVK